MTLRLPKLVEEGFRRNRELRVPEATVYEKPSRCALYNRLIQQRRKCPSAAYGKVLFLEHRSKCENVIEPIFLGSKIQGEVAASIDELNVVDARNYQSMRAEGSSRPDGERESTCSKVQACRTASKSGSRRKFILQKHA